MFNKLCNYLYTIKHLKHKQIIYRLYYTVKKKNKAAYINLSAKKSYSLNLQGSVYSNKSYLGENTFLFLNQIHQFQERIDWDYSGYGKLWTYNLTYFEFLHQSKLDKKTGLKLMYDFIDQYRNIYAGYDSYPISLRNIFWIRFMAKYAIQDERIDAFLYATYKLLIKNLEYHLLGNHLLENAFSLLWGAYYFRDKKFYDKAYILLRAELQEQILQDGGHFELSPMYHQIILYRLLDAINLVENNQQFADHDFLLAYMKEKALSMLRWLQLISFSDGTIPLLNDATFGIAPTTEELNQYAVDLKIITPLDIAYGNLPKLSESGYRCFKNDVYECIIDIGQIGPAYLPGHSHADTFNFVLNVKNSPVIVDTGVSTYNPGETRLYERGTAAHNTVAVFGKNSSEVWSSFRVARRARVKILEDQADCIIAQHDGYKKPGIIHKRQWKFFKDKIEIIDYLTGRVVVGTFYLHIAPRCKPEMKDGIVAINHTQILFENADKVELAQRRMPNGYNQFVDSYVVEIQFREYLKTHIEFF
jgi:hypothetical protein